MTLPPTLTADADAAAVLQLARADIRALEPYRHASADRSLIRLHANESPWPPIAAPTGTVGALNHYPPPQPPELLEALARAWGITPAQILVGRGSDEGIDLLTRAFCAAGQDSVVVSTPTFGMYAVAARIQGASILDVPLLAEQGFAIDLPGIRRALDQGPKIVWLCSPNNPTGNALASADIEAVLAAASGRAVVVVDEAYVEFTGETPWSLAVARYPHLITLRTMSKALGLAGARLGEGGCRRCRVHQGDVRDGDTDHAPAGRRVRRFPAARFEAAGRSDPPHGQAGMNRLPSNPRR